MRDLLSWRLFSYTPLFVCALLFPQRIYQLVRADRPYWSFDFFPHTLRPSIETIIVDFISHLLPSVQFTWCNGLRLNRQLSLPLFFSTRPCNRIKNSQRKGQIKQKKNVWHQFEKWKTNETHVRFAFDLHWRHRLTCEMWWPQSIPVLFYPVCGDFGYPSPNRSDATKEEKRECSGIKSVASLC